MLGNWDVWGIQKSREEMPKGKEMSNDIRLDHLY